jgi:hypothetical protein
MARLNDHVGFKNENAPFGRVEQILTEGQNAFGPFTPGKRGLLVKLYTGKYTEVHESQVKTFKGKDIKTGRDKK